MPDLIVDQVTKEYPTRGEPLKVLCGVSLEMLAGENLAVIGPSGSGKSTLLHVMGTLEDPSTGTITIHGVNPFSLNESQLAHYRNNTIGFVFQDHHLLPQLSALENVLIPTLANGRADQMAVGRAQELLDRVGLADRLEHRPAELSGGERQRVAVARALICQPLLLLADEPTGNLDRSNARAIAELFLTIQSQENTMLIIVTHSHEIAAMLDRRVEFNDGRLE